jgi:hypothetical protein
MYGVIPKITNNQSLILIWHFCRNVISATILFAIMIGGAVSLKFLNDYMVEIKMPESIVEVTHYLEILVFGIDCIVFVVFLFGEAYTMISEIYRETKKRKD